MLSGQVVTDWDFAPVHEFLRSTALSQAPPSPAALVDHGVKDQLDTGAHLGDFTRIWEYLGQPLIVPPPAVQPLPLSDTNGQTRADETIQAWGSKLAKEVRWRDELDGGDLAKFDRMGDPKIIARLKGGRKAKAHIGKEESKAKEPGRAKVLPVGSESENENFSPQRSEARKAIINGIVHGTLEKGHDDLPNVLCLLGGPPLALDAGAWPATYLRVFAPPAQEKNSYATAAVKKGRLMAKLLERFIEERQYLNNVSITKDNNVYNDLRTDVGVHVFVDASNIMIGFHDAIKASRGLHISSRLRRQPLSFHNLSLIMERGRPTAKRVLVGSDNFPAIQEAKAIGYETNILDRVHKAKELTPRQKKFTHRGGALPTGTATSGQSSGSETATYAPQKWVEQAVDEILHLKILESVVDAKEPATMVLATGDAAEAEYSQGFLKMVERALEKGWAVEVVSFRQNLSGMYRRKEFRARWKERFRIVELDGFVEELLGE